jgi:hypothetical protein
VSPEGLGALARCHNRRIFAARLRLATISATLEAGRIPLARFRPWLLAATFSLGFASCFLNPGPELPTSDAESRGGATGVGGSAVGGDAGTSGSGGTATGGSVATGGTAGTSAGGASTVDASMDADADPGSGGAGGEDADDAGPDADDAGG